MKATARRSAPNTEPLEEGGADEGPGPQELVAAALASCTAITIEMYAGRKGWNLGLIEVEVEYEAAERGLPTNFKLKLSLPEALTDEQVQRIEAIACKCPVHRTLAGEVTFEMLSERH
jgi:putative redox protein